MRVTVVPADHLIIRDETVVNLPEWPFDDNHIHAIQFRDGSGEIELQGPPLANEPFEGLGPVQPYLDELDAYLASIPAPESTEPLEPTPSYTAFWDALLASSVYASIRTQSMTSLPMNTLATEFIALLGDAKAGSPNEAAIQASMSAVFSTGTFTEADAEEFTTALAAGLLTDIYSLT